MKFYRRLVDKYFEEYVKTENLSGFKKLYDVICEAYFRNEITTREYIFVMDATKSLHCY